MKRNYPRLSASNGEGIFYGLTPVTAELPTSGHIDNSTCLDAKIYGEDNEVVIKHLILTANNFFFIQYY